MDDPSLQLRKLIQPIIDWYKEFARSFPWRGNPTSYQIAVSEILLQQTFARKVIPVYEIIISEYPDVHHLANADPNELLEIIRPLGLLYRAKTLVNFAQQVNREYGGEIPCEESELMNITGIGRYASAAIMCHACGNNVIPIDTNIQRIFCRVWGHPYPVKNAETRKTIEKLCEGVATSLDSTREIHYALLDMAAVICKFYNPKCDICPVKTMCHYSRERDRDT